MYDAIVDDYILWQAKHLWFKAKVLLAKRMWVNTANFSREELHKLWEIWVYKWYQIEPELESDVQMIQEMEENF